MKRGTCLRQGLCCADEPPGRCEVRPASIEARQVRPHGRECPCFKHTCQQDRKQDQNPKNSASASPQLARWVRHKTASSRGLHCNPSSPIILLEDTQQSEGFGSSPRKKRRRYRWTGLLVRPAMRVAVMPQPTIRKPIQ